MGWLHRLLHYCHQMLTQGCQVHFIAQGRAKCLQYASGIVFAAVEAPVDHGLNTKAQGLEQRGDHQRGHNERNSVGLMKQSAQQGLQAKHQASVDERQQDSERAVNQCAVNNQINVPEARAHDCKTNRNWNGEQYERKNDVAEYVTDRALPDGGQEKSKQDNSKIPSNRQRDAEDNPLRLLSLDRA